MTDTAPEIYPQICFHLSPTIRQWVLLHATDIHSLSTVPGFEGQDVYFYGNHPLKWIRACGIVLAVDDYGDKRLYTLDDSSGATIECLVSKPITESRLAGVNGQAPTPNTSWPRKKQKPVITKPAPSNLAQDEEVGVGTVLDVKGTIRVFRERQIKVDRMTILRTTEQEVEVWEKRNKFWDEVLHKPWVLDPNTVRKCWKEAEKNGMDRDKEKERNKKRKLRRLRGQADFGDGRDIVAGNGGNGAEVRKKSNLRHELVETAVPKSPTKRDHSNPEPRKERRERRIADLGQLEVPILIIDHDRNEPKSTKERRKRYPADLGKAMATVASTAARRIPIEAREGIRTRHAADLGGPQNQRLTQVDTRGHEDSQGREKNQSVLTDVGGVPTPILVLDTQGPRDRKGRKKRLVADLGDIQQSQTRDLRVTTGDQAMSGMDGEDAPSGLRGNDKNREGGLRKRGRLVADFGGMLPTHQLEAKFSMIGLAADDATLTPYDNPTDTRRGAAKQGQQHELDPSVSAARTLQANHPESRPLPQLQHGGAEDASAKGRRRDRQKAELGSYNMGGVRETSNPLRQAQQPSRSLADFGRPAGKEAQQPPRQEPAIHRPSRPLADFGILAGAKVSRPAPQEPTTHRSCRQPVQIGTGIRDLNGGTTSPRKAATDEHITDMGCGNGMEQKPHLRDCERRQRGVGPLADLGQSCGAGAGIYERSNISVGDTTTRARRTNRSKADLGQGNC